MSPCFSGPSRAVAILLWGGQIACGILVVAVVAGLPLAVLWLLQQRRGVGSSVAWSGALVTMMLLSFILTWLDARVDLSRRWRERERTLRRRIGADRYRRA